MELLSWLVLIFVTLFGYSAGAVFGKKTKRSSSGEEPSPSLLDTLAVVVLWIGAVVSRVTMLGRWEALGIWFVAALSVAFLLSLVQRKQDQGKAITQ